MTDARQIFEAQITARDETGAVVDKVHESFIRLAQEAEHVSHATSHMHSPHMWAALNEHVSLTKEHFGELHASIGEVGHSITELLPAMGALGAVGGLAEMFEVAEHMSEAYGELSHSATTLGIPAQQLHNLDLVARLADTSVEGMHKSVSRLNRVIADSDSGKNKNVAGIFDQMNISLKDASGNLRDGVHLLPELADAFAHNTSTASRTAWAFALFGKAGVDMLPMLVKGKKAMEDWQATAGRVGFDFTPYGEHLEAYNESMKKLNMSTEAFTQEVGAKLAPVLQPVVDHMTDWVAANRDWITTGIADEVGELSHWLESLPLQQIASDMHLAADRAGDLVTAIGGPRVAIEGLAALMALKGVMFLAGPISALATLSTGVAAAGREVATLAGLWGGVEAAAVAAGTAEAAAAEAGSVAAATAMRNVSMLGGVFTMIGRVGAVAALAGGYAAHEADADDHVGLWMDRNFKWAENLDDYAARHWWLPGGHKRGWVEKHDSEQRGREYLEGELLKAMPADIPNSQDYAGGGSSPYADPGFVPAPNPFSAPIANSPFMTFPDFRAMQGSGGESTVNLNINMQGAPSGTSATVTQVGGAPRVNPRINTGPAFQDQGYHALP